MLCVERFGVLSLGFDDLRAPFSPCLLGVCKQIVVFSPKVLESDRIQDPVGLFTVVDRGDGMESV